LVIFLFENEVFETTTDDYSNSLFHSQQQK
jgi:hypothetical protein